MSQVLAYLPLIRFIYTRLDSEVPVKGDLPKSWLVEFRHPLKTDNNNKPGKKTRKGLGTSDEKEAQRLTAQLNQLLSDESLWSIGSQTEFDAKVVEIFYGEIAPRTQSATQLRDKLLPLPDHNQGYARVALLGVPDAGKTTLLRQLIGTQPEKERFPSTSVNRATTFPTEITVSDSKHYQAVVTFMSEHETRFEIEESLSAALVKAIDSSKRRWWKLYWKRVICASGSNIFWANCPTQQKRLIPMMMMKRPSQP